MSWIHDKPAAPGHHRSVSPARVALFSYMDEQSTFLTMVVRLRDAAGNDLLETLLSESAAVPAHADNKASVRIFYHGVLIVTPGRNGRRGSYREIIDDNARKLPRLAIEPPRKWYIVMVIVNCVVD